MSNGTLAKAIKNGQFIITTECEPPRGVSGGELKAYASSLKDSVHAISAPESEDGVRLNSMAACTHIAAAGADPMLHLLTRDLNRIALQSMILGAVSVGISNILCTPGRHQALTSSDTARGVFDVDHIQLIQIANTLRKEGTLADGQKIEGSVDILLGTDINPFGDPIDLQVMMLDRAVSAGADFVITQPVFNITKFNVWMSYVRERGLHKKICIIASVMPISTSLEAVQLSEKYRSLDIPEELVERLDTSGDKDASKVHMASEIIASIRKIEGVDGIHLKTGNSAELVTEILKNSGLSRS